MTILNEFDVYRKALKKIDLNEAAIPIYKGRILTENVDMYFKVQKLLNCQPMEQCHRWLYNLDVENLDESECTKINNLYKLGIDNKYIEEPTDDAEVSQDEEDQINADLILPVTDPAPVMPPKQTQPAIPVSDKNTSAYTVVYSAMKDGDIKTGEAYSNSINTRSAKADVISKLEKAGYQNISILAIEVGDPDMVGCDNTFCKQSDYIEPVIETDEDDENIEEADDREPLSKAFQSKGYNTSAANLIGQDEAQFKLIEKDDEEDKKDDDSDDSDDKENDKEKKEDNDSDDSDDSDDKEDDDSDDKEDNDSDDKEKEDDDSDNKENDDSDDKENDDSDDKEKEDDDSDDKLSDQEKTQFKDQYKKAFKAAMQKCKFTEKAFNDLSLEEKVKFFTELNKSWKDKADPTEFMSDKEAEQLEKIVFKK